MKKHIGLLLIVGALCTTGYCSAFHPPDKGLRQVTEHKEKISTINTASAVTFEIRNCDFADYQMAAALDAPDLGAGINLTTTPAVEVRAKTTVAASSDSYRYQRVSAAGINLIVAATSGHKLLHDDPGRTI